MTASVITMMFIMLTTVSCQSPDSRHIKMAALGRPLYLGMLYDCRSDNFITGTMLWDKTKLNKSLDVHPQPKTDLKLTASDSLSDKANLLDMSTSLRASFMGGLVEVEGSAKYLHDTKSSAHQCRVTMHYSQTTKFEQLNINDLGSITYPQVFDQKTATHVVTAVLYGAQAFTVFDYTKAEYEMKEEVEGKLTAMVKNLNIGGEAAVPMTEDEKNMAEKISVTFYGDYDVKENPNTYKEVYKKLPSLLKLENSKGVPVTVWLYPLSLLNDKAAKLEREISMSLLHKTENLLEELRDVKRKCNDLIKNQMTDYFPDLKDRLLKFQELHSYYKTAFQKALTSVLPAIRGGTQEDKALGDILNTHYTSPFTASKMNKWLDDIMTELNILSSYTSGLKDLTVVKSSGSLSSILLDPDVDVVVCLSFTSLKYEDSYLAAFQDFENSKEFKVLEKISETISSLNAAQPWFTSPGITESMKQNLFLFTSFSKANKNEKRIKFIIASISDPNNPGNSIRLYQNGRLTDPKFQPVSKPPKPVVETRDEKVILKLSKSPTGQTVRFRVEYRTTPPTDSTADDDTWKVTDTSDAQSSFTLTGLKPAEQYWVRYRAVSNVGVSEASDSVPFTIQGKLTVYQYSVLDCSMPTLFNKLRYKIMTNMGMSRWSLSTIKSEVTNVVNSPNVPYTGTIPEEVKPGMALYFQGVVRAEGTVFGLNLLPGMWEAGDVIFHMLYRLNDGYVAYKIRRYWAWENIELTSGYPIPKGSAFDIFVVTKTEGYEVYINGQKNYLFTHRMPTWRVNRLNIYGDIVMNIIGTVPNWSTSTFGKELKSGISRRKFSNIQSHVSHPVCSPSKPYLGKIPGGLRAGVALFFQGVVPSDGERFDINLRTGPKPDHDIAFHFNPRVDSVVLNSRRNGKWENEEMIQGGPFARGGAFDIFMVIKTECYEVIVNGLEFCTFNHRIPVNEVTTVYIEKDVFINTFSITEVDDVKMKVTTPANI